MRKICFFMLVVMVAGSILCPLQALGQNDRKVLLIPREGDSGDLDLMIKMEVGVITSLLKQSGYDVDIATPSGKPMLGSTEKLDKIVRLSDVNLDNYNGMILACMAMGLIIPVSPEVVAVVKKALADGKPVAATANASTILAEAGVLKGKKYARFTDPLIETEGIPGTVDPRYTGGIYGGKGVVQDGKIITSGACPSMATFYPDMNDGTTEITQKFIAAINTK